MPGRPAEFFGLRKGFERNDLRRAYNSLIKVYKPERNPEEFQRIRGAYEQLDEQLRYGRTIVQQPVAREWTEQEPPIVRREVVTTTAKPAKLVDRLRDESPEAIYGELKDKASKSPFDFYALALLSDVVEPAPLSFANWFVAGIAAHPAEIALQQLLHDFFRGPQHVDQSHLLVTLLPAVARAVRNDHFYPLTEAAWLMVLRDRPFHEFERLLAECEAELCDAQIAGKMVFTIQLLKTAMWRDPTGAWTQRQCEFIDQNFEQIPNWLEWEVDLLGAARDYRAVRDRSLQPGTLRHQIDEAIVAYFSEPQHVGDRAVLAIQVEILRQSDQLLEEFPIADEGDGAMFLVWNWISADVGSRHLSSEAHQPVNEELWVPRGRVLIARLGEKQSYTLANIRDMAVYFFRWGAIAIAWFWIFGSISITMNALGPDDPGFVVLEVVTGICVATVALFYIIKFTNKRSWHPWLRRHWERRYHALYRRELLEFQQRSRVPGQFFRALFNHLADTDATAKWINHFVQQDYAPAFLAIAQRFEA